MKSQLTGKTRQAAQDRTATHAAERPHRRREPPPGPLVRLQRLTGNGATGRLLQAKLRVSEPGDVFEQEADRVAAQVLSSAAPARVTGRVSGSQVQRACHRCEEEEDERHDMAASHGTMQRKEAGANTSGAAGGGAPARQASVPTGGEPLDASVRGYFEPRFGHDFSDVRVHADARAAESARSFGALAYTVGKDIVFGAGQYAPKTEAGQRLLAHELTHTVQQGAAGAGEPVVMRQHDPAHPSGSGASLPPFLVPGTGLTFQPGPLTATLPGTRLPFPSSLRVTNALSLTGLGAPGIPSFVLDINPDIFMATILQNIDLTTSTTAGTPPGREGEEANQDRISLINPRIFFNPRTGRIEGRALLSVPTGYPRTLRPNNEFPVEFHSSELGQFSGQLSYGPLHLDFTLNLHYDTARLEEAVRPAFAPAGGFAGFWSRFQTILRGTVPGARLDSVSASLQSLLRSVINGRLDAGQFVSQTLQLVAQSIPADVSTESLSTALTQLANEITHPGFSVSGGLRLGPLPLSTFSAHAPTTVPLPRPLYGAPSAFPLTYSAGGVVLAPPGSITNISVPAFGYSRSSYGATSGTSITTALLPTLSPAAISSGQPFVRQFPVYAFAEVSHVRRISTGFDLGVRATLQISTPDLAGPQPQAADPAERFRQTHQDYLDATNRTGQAAPVPNIGLNVFGRFGGPF